MRIAEKFRNAIKKNLQEGSSKDESKTKDGPGFSWEGVGGGAGSC